MWVLGKYLLLQTPSWLLVGGLAAWAVERDYLGAVWAVALLVGFVLKDLVLFPYLKHAYGDGPGRLVGAESMVGVQGVAEDDLEPLGFVRVRGERWRAEAGRASGGRIAQGAPIVVRAVRGLVLEVEPAAPER